MRNAECTPLSPEEEKELLAAFPRDRKSTRLNSSHIH